MAGRERIGTDLGNVVASRFAVPNHGLELVDLGDVDDVVRTGAADAKHWVFSVSTLCGSLRQTTVLGRSSSFGSI
jgi:hypothetical protein